VLHFVNALGQKIGFSLQDIDKPVAVASTSASPETAVADATPSIVPANLNTLEKTRPRVVNETKPNNTVTAKTATPKRPTTTTKKPNSIDDEAEAEEVELTLTLPLLKRVTKLKEFVETHPKSKAVPRARELLISAHAALGDQQLKNGDSVGGVEQLMLAIDLAETSISEDLFSGVISQIPLNLYLRGERTAAFKAAQIVETKFAANPKRLLAVASFYLGIERGDEAARVAEQAVKLAPEMAEAHDALALGLHLSLRLDEAAAEYKRVLDLDPKSSRARGSLADLSRAAGKAEEALALYNEQLQVNPKDKAARTGVVLSLFELGRKDEANSALDSALAEDPRNIMLLTSAAYWLSAHDNNERAFELASKAVTLEPRYTWAQIALTHALLGLKRPLEAERSIRFARLYGKFPTLDYELANVLASLGLYEEAAEVLRESFLLNDRQIEARLGGRLPARETSFVELLAPERRASIYQFAGADTAANARTLKALLSFNRAVSPASEGQKVDENGAVVAAQEFASGTDNMRAYREVYAASRLIRSSIGLPTAIELVDDAKKSVDAAVEAPAATLATQADEFRELRARAIASGNTPEIPEAPRNVLANILRGRIEDLSGWALFNQDKYPEAIEHLKRATTTLPEGTPSWRSALWHLGVALEQSGSKEDALKYYITSYKAGPPDANRRTIIEQLYRKINGTLNGLDERIGPAILNNAPNATTAGEPTSNKPPAAAEATATPSPDAATPAATPEKPTSTPSDTKKMDEAAAKPAETVEKANPEATNVAEPTPSPTPAVSPPEGSSTSETALLAAASRLRSIVKISGQIRDANKAGIANVVVVLISPSGTVLASTTDSEGNYSFNVAPSQRTYRVIPSKDGYTFAPVDKAFAGLNEDQKDIEFIGTSNRSP
jgi:tetratricopeptide (TPR) repeat protein